MQEDQPTAHEEFDQPTKPEEFQRVLGLPTGILLVAGIMIGSGVFKKIVPMAQALPTPTYILAAWIVAGIITMFGAFTYAGLARMTTETGGVYEYLRLIYGDFISFLFGWSVFTIVGSGAVAALAFVFAQSVKTLIPLPLGGWGIKILAVLTIAFLTWFNCRGIKKGSILNNIVTSAKVLGILLLIVAALLYTGHSQQVAVVHPPMHLDNTALLSGFFGAMLSALWAYDGWANITFVTGEIKNPQLNVPYAIIGGVGIAMILYVLLNYGYMHVLPPDRLAQLDTDKIAAAEVAGVLMGRAGVVTIAVPIMTCTFSALNGTIISYPRVYFRMARENVFFKNAGKIHPTSLAPHIALIYSAIWSAVLVCSGTFDQITDLIILASYAFFGLAAFGLVRMKVKRRITSKVIGYPVIPWIIILFCAALVINTFITQPRASLRGLLLILSGVPFYLFFKRRGLKPDPS
jgi:APA family basic amino acid/polyamine antiporter